MAMESDKDYKVRLLRIKKLMEKDSYTLGAFVPGEDVDVDNMLTWPKDVRYRLLSHINKEPGVVYNADHVETLLENLNMLVDYINVKLKVSVTKINDDTYYTVVTLVEPESFNIKTITQLCDMTEAQRADERRKEELREARKRKALAKASVQPKKRDKDRGPKPSSSKTGGRNVKGRVPKQTDDLEALHKSLVDEVAVPGAEKQDVEVVDDDSDEELKEEDDIWDTGEVGESESAKVARMKIQLETDPASFLGMYVDVKSKMAPINTNTRQFFRVSGAELLRRASGPEWYKKIALERYLRATRSTYEFFVKSVLKHVQDTGAGEPKRPQHSPEHLRWSAFSGLTEGECIKLALHLAQIMDDCDHPKQPRLTPDTVEGICELIEAFTGFYKYECKEFKVRTHKGGPALVTAVMAAFRNYIQGPGTVQNVRQYQYFADMTHRVNAMETDVEAQTIPAVMSATATRQPSGKGKVTGRRGVVKKSSTTSSSSTRTRSVNTDKKNLSSSSSESECGDIWNSSDEDYGDIDKFNMSLSASAKPLRKSPRVKVTKNMKEPSDSNDDDDDDADKSYERLQIRKSGPRIKSFPELKKELRQNLLTLKTTGFYPGFGRSRPDPPPQRDEREGDDDGDDLEVVAEVAGDDEGDRDRSEPPIQAEEREAPPARLPPRPARPDKGTSASEDLFVLASYTGKEASANVQRILSDALFKSDVGDIIDVDNIITIEPMESNSELSGIFSDAFISDEEDDPVLNVGVGRRRVQEFAEWPPSVVTRADSAPPVAPGSTGDGSNTSFRPVSRGAAATTPGVGRSLPHRPQAAKPSEDPGVSDLTTTTTSAPVTGVVKTSTATTEATSTVTAPVKSKTVTPTPAPVPTTDSSKSTATHTSSAKTSLVSKLVGMFSGSTDTPEVVVSSRSTPSKSAVSTSTGKSPVRAPGRSPARSTASGKSPARSEYVDDTTETASQSSVATYKMIKEEEVSDDDDCFIVESECKPKGSIPVEEIIRKVSKMKKELPDPDDNGDNDKSRRRPAEDDDDDNNNIRQPENPQKKGRTPPRAIGGGTAPTDILPDLTSPENIPDPYDDCFDRALKITFDKIVADLVRSSLEQAFAEVQSEPPIHINVPRSSKLSLRKKSPFELSDTSSTASTVSTVAVEKVSDSSAGTVGSINDTSGETVELQVAEVEVVTETQEDPVSLGEDASGAGGGGNKSSRKRKAEFGPEKFIPSVCLDPVRDSPITVEPQRQPESVTFSLGSPLKTLAQSLIQGDVVESGPSPAKIHKVQQQDAAKLQNLMAKQSFKAIRSPPVTRSSARAMSEPAPEVGRTRRQADAAPAPEVGRVRRHLGMRSSSYKK